MEFSMGKNFPFVLDLGGQVPIFMRKKIKRQILEEPRPEGEEWVEFGGHLIWAAGFTEGGAPYGLTVDEVRQMNEREEPRPEWALAKQVLRQAFLSWGVKPSEGSIGWIRFLGDGLDYRVYC